MGKLAAALERVETPFVGLSYGPATVGEVALESPILESPFLSRYGDDRADPAAAGFHRLTAELHDPQFEEALAELAAEATAVAGELRGSAAQRTLATWIEPAAAAAERVLDDVAQRARLDPASLGEATIDQLFESVEVPVIGAPALDQFVGKLVKKVKKAAKTVAKVAKKGIALVQKLNPIHAVLEKLKPLVRPLLQNVLKSALGRLPPAVRPLAEKLAKHFVGEVHVEDPLHEASSSADLRDLQLEVDARIAAAALLPERTDALFEIVDRSESDVLGELDAARARFVERAFVGRNELGPEIQQFVPAILPAVKVGIGVVGRKNVVDFLAKLVAKVIEPIAGRGSAPLSAALVDAGLGLLGLEVAATPALGAHAVAATVEDAVRRLAEVPDHLLEDPHNLETFATEAVMAAARHHIPGSLFRRDPPTHAPWVPVLFGDRPAFKKHAEIFEVDIPDAVAREVTTFGGTSLAGHLRAAGVAGSRLRARVHLYEVMPGTRLGHVAAAERTVAGFGARGRAGRRFHPLTRRAAALLLRRRDVGTDTSLAHLATPEHLAVGQQLYVVDPIGERATDGRASGVWTTLDFPGSRVVVGLFLSEADSQAILAGARGEGVLDALRLARETLTDGLRAALASGLEGRVRIVHDAVPQREARGSALRRVAPALLDPWTDRLATWSLQGVTELLKLRLSALAAAVESPAEGVTVQLTLDQVPGLGLIGDVLAGRPLPSDVAARLNGRPVVCASVLPGFEP